jgi:hypothetical protein
VAAEQQLLHLLERALHGRDLQEDVHAVGVVCDHALQALHLPSIRRSRPGALAWSRR